MTADAKPPESDSGSQILLSRAPSEVPAPDPRDLDARGHGPTQSASFRTPVSGRVGDEGADPGGDTFLGDRLATDVTAAARPADMATDVTQAAPRLELATDVTEAAPAASGREEGGRPRTTRRLDEPPLRPGQVLAERYEVERRIGSGGMGTVYLGEHVVIGRKVAIKVLSPSYGEDDTLKERFLREARSASKVRHPNVVEIMDFGELDDGLPYFVMEYLSGDTLAERLRARGRLDWTEARSFVRQLLAALGAAHERGMVHRDMKPDNCVIVSTDKGEVLKVLDFGIAKVVDPRKTSKALSLTQTGMIMGTAAYMSPEQARADKVDGRTDLYSVGVILFELITGQLPFTARGFMGMVAKHIADEVLPPSTVAPDAGIPPELDAIVLEAMAKEPSDRFEDAAAFSAALDMVDASPIRAQGLPPVAWVAIGVGVVVLALVILLVATS